MKGPPSDTIFINIYIPISFGWLKPKHNLHVWQIFMAASKNPHKGSKLGFVNNYNRLTYVLTHKDYSIHLSGIIFELLLNSFRSSMIRKPVNSIFFKRVLNIDKVTKVLKDAFVSLSFQTKKVNIFKV